MKLSRFVIVVRWNAAVEHICALCFYFCFFTDVELRLWGLY